MTEDLQHLLEKIQKDGVDRAENEASRIADEARAKADKILKDAKDEADKIIKKAKDDAVTFEEKGRKSLEQASRDVVISTKAGIQAAVASVISTETAKAMSDDVLSTMLVKIVEAYCRDSAATDVLVNEKDAEKFKQFVLGKLSQEAQQGITIVPEGSVSKGFKVLIKDKHMEHDLTDEAVSEALSRILRPHIAEILNKSL